MIAPPVGDDSKFKAERTVTEKVLVADVKPVFENVKVTLYVPAEVGVPETFVPFAESHEAPEMVTEHPDSETVGLNDHAEPTTPYESGVPVTVMVAAFQTA